MEEFQGVTSPGTFFTVFQARENVLQPPNGLDMAQLAKTGRKRASKAPYAPMERDPEAAAEKVRDRRTDAPMRREELTTLAEALAGYAISPEPKFENGDRFDAGFVTPKPVKPKRIILIGKEANGVGEFGEVVDPKANELVELPHSIQVDTKKESR